MMKQFDKSILKNLYIPPHDSHKGQNGKVLVVGGSQLFHAASLWALEIASKIVDMVFYASVPENNAIIEKAKEEFQNGIVVPRDRLADYIEEADAILIGPGMPRQDGQEEGDDDTKQLTERLLKEHPEKQWVIDGGSLQVMNKEILHSLRSPILTPHPKEFEMLFGEVGTEESVSKKAKEYGAIILLKGETDIVCSPIACVSIAGGNAGMTKGGTGDVLAGLVAALASKNEPFVAAQAASYINKKAGEKLFTKVGYFFNSSDLVDEIPRVMKQLL